MPVGTSSFLDSQGNLSVEDSLRERWSLSVDLEDRRSETNSC